MSFEVGYNINFRIPDNWGWVALQQVLADEKRPVISGPFGSNIGSRFFVENGVPVIRGNNLTLAVEDRFVDEGFVFLTDEKAKELNTWAMKDDLVFTAAGTIGQVGIIGAHQKYQNYIISNKQIRARVDKGRINPLYAYYWFAQPRMADFIKQRNTGTTIPLINLSVVKSLPVALPPLETQNRIVEILSSLDDKIELNRQMNATLEAMAQALFKEWFVEFNYPGANGEMEESEMGMVPRGWRVEKVGDLVQVKGGTTPSTKNAEYWDGEFHWATPKDLSGLKSPVLLGTERRITEAGVRQISSGVLPKGTLLLSSRAPIGYLALAEIPVSINQGFIAINGLTVSNQFMLFWLKENMVTVMSRANGSTFLEISKSNFKAIPILISDDELAKRFDTAVNPLIEIIATREQEILTLQVLRDSILPRLMKGEIEF